MQVDGVDQIGNLGYKTTREEIQKHFTEAAGSPPSVRLLTTKPTKAGEAAKSRGIAFVELADSTAMQACLKLHHTSIQGRTINVELTAGGGGKSDTRSAKIKARNERVGGQRERRSEREKEEEAAKAPETSRTPNTASAGSAPASRRPHDTRVSAQNPPNNMTKAVYDGPDQTPDGVKIRGGRRVKSKPKVCPVVCGRDGMKHVVRHLG